MIDFTNNLSIYYYLLSLLAMMTVCTEEDGNMDILIYNLAMQCTSKWYSFQTRARFSDLQVAINRHICIHCPQRYYLCLERIYPQYKNIITYYIQKGNNNPWILVNLLHTLAVIYNTGRKN